MSNPLAVLEHLKTLQFSPEAEEVFASLRRFTAWWGGELRTLLPTRLQAFLWKHPDRFLIEVSGETLTIWRDGLDGASAATVSSESQQPHISEIPRLMDQTTRRILMIPADAALKRSLMLPPVRASQIRSLLSFELLRISPMDPDQVYCGFRARETDREAKKTPVEVAIIKKAAIDVRLRRLRELGIEPTDVFLDSGGGTHTYFDFSREVLPRPGTPLHRWVERALAVMGAILLVGLISIGFSNNLSRRTALETLISQEKQTAREFDSLQSQIKTEDAILEVIPARKQEPRVLDLLAEVTNRLPDGTWLFQLQLSSKEGRGNGHSPAAYSLIDAFAASPLITNPRFKASITEGPTHNLQRFDLAFDIRPRGTK